MIKIRKEWLDATDELINKAEAMKITMMNGELLIAKQPLPKKTEGNIYLPTNSSQMKMSSYFQGYGRIIKLPATGFLSTEGEIQLPYEFRVGDIVFYNHAARLKLNWEVVNLLFEEVIEHEPKESITDLAAEHHDEGMIYTLTFPNVSIIKPIEQVRALAV